jgi:hypothetical protein
VDVSRVVPLIVQTLLYIKLVPTVSAFGNGLVIPFKLFRSDRFSDQFLNFAFFGPYILHVDWLVICAISNWLCFKIDVHSASQGVQDY